MIIYLGSQKMSKPLSGFGGYIQLLTRAVGLALRHSAGRPRAYKRLIASSLAFKSVLALVPVLAILMAVLAGEAFTEKREAILDRIVDVIYPVDNLDNDKTLDPSEKQNLREMNQVGKRQIRRSIKKFAEHSKKVGWTGLLAFAVVVFLLLRDVETSFNFLWGVSRGRPLPSQFVRHTLLFLVGPLMLISVMTMKDWFHGWGIVKPFWNGWFLSVGVPFVFLWAGCAAMYAWIPNAKVGRKAALSAGFLAAFLLEVGRRGMNYYTVHVMDHSKAYGALWTFPVILLWLYVSWTLILFGAEVSFYLQNPPSPGNH